MSMFILAISCFHHFQFTLIYGPNIPGYYPTLFFTALGFAHHQRHPLVGSQFCFGSASSLLLEQFLCSSPVAYWTCTDLGVSFTVIPFCLFILFMGFSRQECWNGLPFPSPVDHVLSELSRMIHPSRVALQGMAYSFIELDKGVVHVISLFSFLFCCCWFFCLFLIILIGG